MGKLRLASTETKRLDLGDDDFLEVKTDISKRDFNKLMLAMPDRELTEEEGVTPAESVEFSKGLFDALVVGWSLDAPATADNYENLHNDAAQAVDSALVEHFASLSPTPDETSKVSTSQGKRRKG